MSRNCVCYFGDTSVQAILKGREPWFLAQDLGTLLELTNIRFNLKQVPKEEKDLCYLHTASGEFKTQRRRVSVVNEAGLYRLIMMSHTEAAEKFKTWVVREVLPSIRKTGKYEYRKREAGMVFMQKEMPRLEAVKIALGRPFRPLEWIGEKAEA